MQKVNQWKSINEMTLILTIDRTLKFSSTATKGCNKINWINISHSLRTVGGKYIKIFSSAFLSVPERMLVCCRWYPGRQPSWFPGSLPPPDWTKTLKHLWCNCPTSHGPVPLSQDKFDLQFYEYNLHVHPNKDIIISI